MKSDDEIRQELEARFARDARPMPAAILETALLAIPETRQRGRGVASSARAGLLLRLAGAATIVVAGILVGSGILSRAGWWPLFGGPVGGGACVPSVVGVTAWWPMDGSGREIVAGHDLALIGGAAFAPGLVGEALRLDGATGHAQASDAPGFAVGRADFSVVLWVRFDDTNGEQVLIEKWVQRFSGPSSGWTLTKLADNSIGFYTEGASGSDAGASAPGGLGAQSGAGAVTPGMWLNVAAVRRANEVDLLVNGVVVDRQVGSQGALDLSSGSPVNLGHRGSSDDTPGSEQTGSPFFLHGEIDEVQLLIGRSLSTAEIQQIVAADRRGQCKG